MVTTLLAIGRMLLSAAGSRVTSMAATFLPAAQRPLLVAHRGLAVDGAADNTLAAYEHALRAGADAVECDLRLGNDGALILFHDREVELDGVVTLVGDLDRDQRARRAIPVYDDVLALLERWPGRGVVIDVKTAAAGDALFAAHQPSSQAMVISFSDLVVARAIEHGWSAAFIEAFLPMVLRDLTPPGALFSPSLGVHEAYADELTDAELARSIVGTVDDPEQANALGARGVLGMTTKRVDLLRRALPATGR
jgi:glycerophosphoryl diester phosphodiesterase